MVVSRIPAVRLPPEWGLSSKFWNARELVDVYCSEGLCEIEESCYFRLSKGIDALLDVADIANRRFPRSVWPWFVIISDFTRAP